MFPLLQRDFILGWKNIENERYVGLSFGYSKEQTCVGTTNGAGAHNVQIFVLSPDLVVLHALPGFWHPEDLARELEFSKVLARLWQDDTRSLGQKWQLFRRLQLAEPEQQPRATFARSAWQGFDADEELKRAKAGPRDTVVVDALDRRRMKPINVLVHERMAQRPFVPFAQFDVAAFTDYGLRFYDNNRGFDRQGHVFAAAQLTELKREQQERKAQERARRTARTR